MNIHVFAAALGAAAVTITAAPQSVRASVGAPLSPENQQLVTDYIEVYSWSLIAFTSVPASYRGGPADPHYVDMERRLKLRRDRLRGFVVARVGDAMITELEQDSREGTQEAWPTTNLALSERTREHYERLLRKLERRVAKIGRSGPGSQPAK